LTEKYRQQPLEALFCEKFHTALPESLNQEQRLVIVATDLDPQSERIVQFLSAQYGVNINVVFFDYYRHDRQELVGRSWLIAPEEVQRKAETLGTSRKRPILTVVELAKLAEDRGVGTLYSGLHEGLSRLCDQVGTTQSNVSYRWRSLTGSRTALVSVYPKASGPESGLIADIRVDDLAKQLGLAPNDLRAALSERLLPRQIPGLFVYAEAYAFRTHEDVDRFLAKLAGASAEIEGGAVPLE
jgi:hypothetical protein